MSGDMTVTPVLAEPFADVDVASGCGEPTGIGVRVQSCRDLTPAQARQLAAALLRAVDMAGEVSR